MSLDPTANTIVRATATAALVLTLCVLGAGPASARGASAKVAVLVPLSGEYAALGEAVLDGLRWGQATAGTELELVPVDSAASPEEAASALEKLAEDEAFVAAIGPIGAKVSEAVAPRAQALAIPTLVMTSLPGVEDEGRYVFRVRVAPEDQARLMGTLAATRLESKRAAIFYPDNGYGRGCAEAFFMAYVKAGGDIASFESYDPDESKPDTEAELLVGRKWRRANGKHRGRRLRGIDFDTLFVPDAAAGLGRALAFLELAGMKPGEVQLVGTSAWAAGELSATEGRATGGLFPRVFDPEANEEVVALVEAFEEAFGRLPTDLEAQARDGFMLLAEAASRCRSVSASKRRSCVLQGLASVSVDGIHGTVRFGKHRNLERELLMFEVGRSGEMWPAYE